MPRIMKNWTFNEKVHRIRKTSQNRFSHLCQILRYWRSDSWSAFPEIEKISQNLGPKLGQKFWYIESLMKRCIRIRKTSQKRFFDLLQYITILKKWFISVFPEIEKISQTCGLKFMPKIMKNWFINEKVHRIRKNLTEPRLRVFATYCDAEDVIHKRISWNWENISKCGPKVRPNFLKNWIV